MQYALPLPEPEVTLYRVEHAETGKGPYAGTGRYAEIHDRAGWEPLPQHPTPYDDGLEFNVFSGRCFAFITREQFLAWFDDKARRRLAAEGFALALYHVATHYVRHGGCQCVFCKEQARRVGLEALT